MLDPIELQVAHRRAARRLRGDGRRADPLGALLEHQGAPRRLDRAVRRRRADGDAGRAHPRAPRRDARRRRGGARRAPRAGRLVDPQRSRSPAARTCPTSRSITPVFAWRRAGTLLGFAASRAHHADVGARVPGSMPADSRTLAEEGVVISPRPLDERALEELVARDAPAARAARRPAWRSSPPTASAPLRLAELARAGSGPSACARPPTRCSTTAERRTRACLAELRDGVREARDVLEAPEGDLELRLRAELAGERLRARLHRQRRPARGQPQLPAGRHRARRACSPCACSPTPTSRPRPAPTARSRCAPRRAALLNARARRGRRGRATSRPPRASPTWCSSAFGRAQGQGTMNNLTLGDERFSYYETLGGGQGACADADGPSGVHVAMSNTLNTPIEALEREFPLRVVEYALRRGLGRGGAPPRRRRRRARAGGAARDELLADRRAPPPRAARGGRRRADGCARDGTCSTAGRCRARRRGRSRGPAAAHRNPRWGRIRGS